MNIAIISPHCDDAIFSLGGFLMNNSSKNIDVYNVFTTTNYSLLEKSGTKIITDKRKKEDMSVMKKLRASTQYMDYPDACIRYKRISSSDTYLNPLLVPEEDKIWDKVFNSIKDALKNNYTYIFFPLGIGYHIDHRILATIGRIYSNKRGGIIFYEDLTYAMSTNNLAIQKYIYEFDSALQAQIFPISSLIKKISDVKEYKSQVNRDVIKSIKVAALQKKGERVWLKRPIDI